VGFDSDRELSYADEVSFDVMKMDETEAWVTILKYGVVLVIVAGICHTLYKVALLFA